MCTVTEADKKRRGLSRDFPLTWESLYEYLRRCRGVRNSLPTCESAGRYFSARKET